MRTIAVALAACLAVGCGHSEDEWQAQLDKYKKLQDHDAGLQKQLDAEKGHVADLEKQLRDMGVDIKSKSAELAERDKALAEYKARAAKLEAIRARFEALRKKLEQLTTIGLEVHIRHNRMVISLPGDVLFDSGRDTLKKEGEEIVAKVAGVVKADKGLLDRDYEVAGHTDAQPLLGGVFHDNWGLSLMRARQVLLYLIGKNGGLPS